MVRAIQDVTSRRSRLRRSANPADSFRLRASSSILRNRPTRSASYGRPMPCSAFSSSNSIWRMVLSVSRFTRTVGVRPEVGSRCARLLMTGNARNRPQAVRQPDYARTAWATRSYQSMDKKSSECNSLAAPPIAPLINPSHGHASGTNDARTHGDLGDIASLSRSADQHKRSRLCSDAHDTRVGRYPPQNRVLQHRPLAPQRLSPQLRRSCQAFRPRSLMCPMFS